MKLLVTGGAGYLGSTLVSLLLDSGHHVRVLDCLMHGGDSLLGVWYHPHFEFRYGDMRDQKTLRAALQGVDTVVHLAAIVGDPACARQSELARSVNLEASLALLAFSRSAGVSRFICASTCSNYGRMQDPEAYVDEASELCPISLYAETKVAMEQAVLQASSAGSFCSTALRFATVFGVSPRMRFDLTVNEFTAEMLLHRHLVVYGKQYWRPYIHVRDAARAIALVLDSAKDRIAGQVFNVGSTSLNFQKQQLVDLILRQVPGGEVEYVDQAEDPRDYRVSFEKIRRELGFDITRSVSDGIAEIIRLIQGRVISDIRGRMYRN